MAELDVGPVEELPPGSVKIVVAERDIDRDLVAAQRVLPFGLRVGVVHDAMAARVLVVVEDDLPVHLVEFVHANTLCTVCNPSTSWSISSCTV